MGKLDGTASPSPLRALSGRFRAFPGLSGTFPGVVVAVPETPGKRPENPESARKVPETPGKKRPESTPANSRKSRTLNILCYEYMLVPLVPP